ncbi:MAG: hypothetical protein FWC34_00080, partial [Bacteroidetes bacterium]|nr:hypothetical protein [Bacteroidota bacterium]
CCFSTPIQRGTPAIVPNRSLPAVACHSPFFLSAVSFKVTDFVNFGIIMLYVSISGGWANASKIALAIFGHEACFSVGIEFHFSEQIPLHCFERAQAKAR